MSGQEQWKDVPGFEGIYQASSCGNVKNIKTGKQYKPWIDRGYLKMALYKGKFKKNF